MSDSDDFIGDDPEEMQEIADEFERRRHALYERVCDFMDEEDIDEAYVAQLLLDCALSMRMTAYGMGVENPSAAGLKMDLDRLGRDIGEMLRTAKKGADEFIRLIKDERARAEAAAEPEEDAPE
jgi:predicted site-specific integrase-resolvase